MQQIRSWMCSWLPTRHLVKWFFSFTSSCWRVPADRDTSFFCSAKHWRVILSQMLRFGYHGICHHFWLPLANPIINFDEKFVSTTYILVLLVPYAVVPQGNIIWARLVLWLVRLLIFGLIGTCLLIMSYAAKGFRELFVTPVLPLLNEPWYAMYFDIKLRCIMR